MAKVHISATRTTNKTIRAIDQRRERERKQMMIIAKDHSEELCAKLVQRLIDREIIETTSVQAIREAFIAQINDLNFLDDFEIQLKIAPIRTLVPDPNFISLYLTQYIIEDLINNAAIEDIFGDDIDIYRAVNSVFNIVRPQ